MKILKVRRGFTTNSSGTNEWIPTQSVNSNTPPPSQTIPNLTKVGTLTTIVMLFVVLDKKIRKVFNKSKSSSEGQ